MMWNCEEQHVAFWKKEAGASAISCIHFRQGFVSVWIDLLDNIDLASATDHINAITFTIVEDVVGIAGDIKFCNNIARICVKHDQLGGKTAADKLSMIRFI